MPSAPAPLFLVFNAASGRGDTPDVSRHVAERLRAAGRRAECFVARQPGELGAVIGRAVNAARDARGIVVAAGGDSTLNAVAQAVWNAGLPMGVLPQGSLNYFGRTHGMSTDLDAAVDALLARACSRCRWAWWASDCFWSTPASACTRACWKRAGSAMAAAGWWPGSPGWARCCAAAA
ncbi:diacylglycerol/lipid kinase family protein [Ottowia beijingensis]|uniref:diacylglycerol/lipid kinase family protein n=1 Tax=Ottowia beijingensis TaxID=1207057 RepID=UPI00214DBC9A|nr:acylglycerol kinase family protein [Ottowia beijingensis]